MGYKDKEKQRACHKKYYEANKEKVMVQVRKANRELRIRGRAFLQTYLEQHPCVDCGEADPIVLEFDHVRGTKVGNVKEMVRACSIKTLQEEIDKCEVRCANCHRRITRKRRLEKMEANKEPGDKQTPVEALR